jgi:hypothetical protein
MGVEQRSEEDSIPALFQEEGRAKRFNLKTGQKRKVSN